MPFLETVIAEMNRLKAIRLLADGYEGVTHAGIALVSVDGRSVMLAQRTPDETDAPDVAETWEFPGGGLDEGEDPWAGAMREFSEEVGWGVPHGQVVNGWRSDDGVYQGFVYRTDVELDLTNWAPTEETQAIGWFTREQISEMGDAVRPEVRDQTDWDMIFGVSGNEGQDMTEADDYASIEVNPIPVHGVVAPEETPTGDARGFAAGAMTRRPLRLPLRDTATDTGAHTGAFVAGSVDRLMRADGMVHFEGLLMPGPAEDLIAKMQFFDGRFGVSVDGDQGSIDAKRTTDTQTLWFDQVRAAGITAVDIPAFHEAYVAFGPHPSMPNDDTLAASAYDSGNLIGGRPMVFDRGPGWVTDPKATNRIHDYWTKKGEEGYNKVRWGEPGDFARAKALIGAKIAQHSPDKMKYLNQIIAQWHHDALGYWPATHAKMERGGTTKAALEEAVSRVEREDIEAVTDDADSLWEAVLVSSASGKRAKPPLSYFHQHPSMIEDPFAAESGALVIEEPDANGIIRTWGYAAEWGVCHVGMDGQCTEPPRAYSDDYSSFHLGRTKTEEGYIYTGVLTAGVSHRDGETILSESVEQCFFDNINNAWAAVRVGENDRGIWFSGVVLPKVDDDLIVKIEASGQVSGEWLRGEMRACLTVNIPGFPNERPSAVYDEDGHVLALAASAFNTWECGESPADRMAALREVDAEVRFARLKAEFLAEKAGA
jgi:8-oxo-dGTP pyrophosphatase MutT (NUDIX family)